MSAHSTPLQTVRDLFDVLLEQPGFQPEHIPQHLAAHYRQEVDGQVLDLAGFTAHLAHLKTLCRSIRIEILSSAVNGNIVFTRHRADVVKHSGDTLSMLVMAEFTVENGKISACRELTHQLSGDSSDRDIGSRV